jgi:sporulation-control protein spo0M
MVDGEKFKEIKALLERADRELPEIKSDPFLKRVFALFDGMMLRGVSQEKAAYMVACVFNQAFMSRQSIMAD